MLVLTRRLGEALIIGENIKVYILDVRNSQIKLGVDAPREVSIHREEVHVRIKQALLVPEERPALAANRNKSL
jgi:carbon storage regulator